MRIHDLSMLHQNSRVAHSNCVSSLSLKRSRLRTAPCAYERLTVYVPLFKTRNSAVWPHLGIVGEAHAVLFLALSAQKRQRHSVMNCSFWNLGRFMLIEVFLLAFDLGCKAGHL